MKFPVIYNINTFKDLSAYRCQLSRQEKSNSEQSVDCRTRTSNVEVEVLEVERRTVVEGTAVCSRRWLWSHWSFKMSERKVLNKYYPPDFDPANIPRGPGGRNKTFIIRLMAPCNMRCTTCGKCTRGQILVCRSVSYSGSISICFITRWVNL